MKFAFQLFLIFFIFTFPIQFAFAQKTVTSTGESKLKCENSMSYNECVAKAVQNAKEDAIENAFGRSMSQTNTNYIKNRQSAGSNSKDGDVQTSSTFVSLSNSYINGTWVEDLSEPVIKKIISGEETWISVKVKGRVREIVALETAIEAFTLSCPHINCKTVKFNNNQDFYLYFKSPENGFVSIFEDDPDYQYTFLLFPYNGSMKYKSSVPVEADKEYILFDEKHNYFHDGTIDGITMFTAPDKDVQQNRFVVLFSSQELNKPAFESSDAVSKKLLDAESYRKSIRLPKGIPTEKFTEWLQEYRVRDKKLQVKEFVVDVSKK